MFRLQNGSYSPDMWPKIKNLQFEFGKKLDHYFGAKFYEKSNDENGVFQSS